MTWEYQNIMGQCLFSPVHFSQQSCFLTLLLLLSGQPVPLALQGPVNFIMTWWWEYIWLYPSNKNSLGIDVSAIKSIPPRSVLLSVLMFAKHQRYKAEISHVIWFGNPELPEKTSALSPFCVVCLSRDSARSGFQQPESVTLSRNDLYTPIYKDALMTKTPLTPNDVGESQ